MGTYANTNQSLKCFVCGRDIEYSTVYWAGSTGYENYIDHEDIGQSVRFQSLYESVTIHMHPACVFDMCTSLMRDAKGHTVFISDSV